jgi:hypothetical protein
MVILVMTTLVVLSAVTLSTGNVKAVSNMQFRDTAFAAANVAIEQVVSTGFMDAPSNSTLYVDMDHNGVDDYRVLVPAPSCIYWRRKPNSDLDPTNPSDLPCYSSSRVGGVSGGSASSFCADTRWEVRAQVVDLATGNSAVDAATGAAVTVTQGIEARMSVALAGNTCD